MDFDFFQNGDGALQLPVWYEKLADLPEISSKGNWKAFPSECSKRQQSNRVDVNQIYFE